MLGYLLWFLEEEKPSTICIIVYVGGNFVPQFFISKTTKSFADPAGYGKH